MTRIEDSSGEHRPPDAQRVRVTSISLYGPDSQKLESFLQKVNQYNQRRGLPRASRSDIIRRAIRLLSDDDVEIFARRIAGLYEGEEAT